MQQNSWQWKFLNNCVVTCFGVGQQTLVLKFFYSFVDDILIVPYEDLPDGDKDIINKAIEEFQNKYLLSYAKTCDNTIVHKYPLLRVLLHGQTDVDEAEDRRFFMEAVNKSVHDAISNHNEVFLNTFHNTMEEVFYGFLVDQVGQAYYNIPYLLAQGTN